MTTVLSAPAIAACAIGAGCATGGGNSGIGTIKGSALEQSTVDTADQMTLLIVAQQAYSMNSQVITAANEMMTTAMGMKG